MKDKFSNWYFDKFIAPARCPCSWRVKIPPLIWLCGKIDEWWLTANDVFFERNRA